MGVSMLFRPYSMEFKNIPFFSIPQRKLPEYLTHF